MSLGLVPATSYQQPAQAVPGIAQQQPQYFQAGSQVLVDANQPQVVTIPQAPIQQQPQYILQQPNMFGGAALGGISIEQGQGGVVGMAGQPAVTQVAAPAPVNGGGGFVFKGVVKRWNVQKGYGFIQPAEGGEDVFVHHSVVHSPGFRSLLLHSDVEYEREQVPNQPNRFRATKVTGVNGSYVKGANNVAMPPQQPPQQLQQTQPQHHQVQAVAPQQVQQVQQVQPQQTQQIFIPQQAQAQPAQQYQQIPQQVKPMAMAGVPQQAAAAGVQPMYQLVQMNQMNQPLAVPGMAQPTPIATK